MQVMCLQELSSVRNVGVTMSYEELAFRRPTLIAICHVVEIHRKLAVEAIESMSIN